VESDCPTGESGRGGDGGFLSPPPADELMSEHEGETVYIVAQIAVEDWDTYRSEYMPTTFDRITAHDGEVLVASEAAEELEGDWAGNWTVVIEFPSEDDAYAFMQDEEYVEAMSARHEAAAWSDIAMLPGFDG
jgi:uncharacterized protein (DUF1330 family)